jgi:hypothetical protein
MGSMSSVGSRLVPKSIAHMRPLTFFSDSRGLLSTREKSAWKAIDCAH